MKRVLNVWTCHHCKPYLKNWHQTEVSEVEALQIWDAVALDIKERLHECQFFRESVAVEVKALNNLNKNSCLPFQGYFFHMYTRYIPVRDFLRSTSFTPTVTNS